MFTNRRRDLKKVMAVPKRECLTLFDFDDEEDDDINVLENTLSEGKAYSMLAIDCVLWSIRLLPSYLKWNETLLKVFIYFFSNFIYNYLFL